MEGKGSGGMGEKWYGGAEVRGYEGKVQGRNGAMAQWQEQ